MRGPKARNSRGFRKRKIDRHGFGFPVLDTFGKNPQRQNLRLGHGLGGRSPIGQDARQLGYFSYPATIRFTFDFERKVHTPTIPLRTATLEPAQALGCANNGALELPTGRSDSAQFLHFCVETE